MEGSRNLTVVKESTVSLVEVTVESGAHAEEVPFGSHDDSHGCFLHELVLVVAREDVGINVATGCEKLLRVVSGHHHVEALCLRRAECFLLFVREVFLVAQEGVVAGLRNLQELEPDQVSLVFFGQFKASA